MAGRRRFGKVRQLPSCRWQARYLGPNGLERPAPGTFRTKRDAEASLIRTEAQTLDGAWLSPEAAGSPFASTP